MAMSEESGHGRGKRSHRLDALLAPASIALVGASARPNSSGQALVTMCRVDGYQGRVYPVNPRYETIDGLTCFPSLSDLPEVPEHAVLSVPNAGLEAVFEEALELGIRAFTIFASGYMEGDRDPPLGKRLARRAKAVGAAICGLNCMGFYNPIAGLRVASFLSPPGLRKGGVVWLAQSGSAFSGFSHNERRLGYALCVSLGAETATTVADYMDWALSRDETRVIGLFLETVRDPAAFTRALERAAERDIPVAALKVGRTARSAAMARTHTGAIAGNDAAYRALFRRYGVMQVDSYDEMLAVLALGDAGRRPGRGGLATMHDSGGEREMLVDIAERLAVPLAEIGADTKAKLKAQLDPGLAAENPLDAFGTDRLMAERYQACMTALLEDPGVAMAAFFSNFREHYWYSAEVLKAMLAAAADSMKPVFLASNTTLTVDTALMLEAASRSVPVVKGTEEALKAVALMFARRDWRETKPSPPPAIAAGLARTWCERIELSGSLSEQEGLALLADYGIATPAMLRLDHRDDIATAARALRPPYVLKTAAGHAHKSDVGGVRIGLADAEALEAAYTEMASRLGPAALVMEMVPAGVEIGLGAVIDPSFGPVIMVAAGGILIELLADRAVALAPFGADEADRLLSELRVDRLLRGVRGKPPVDRAALCEMIARFSVLAHDLRDVVVEIDVNPVIASPTGSWAVDCLVIPRKKETI